MANAQVAALIGSMALIALLHVTANQQEWTRYIAIAALLATAVVGLFLAFTGLPIH